MTETSNQTPPSITFIRTDDDRGLQIDLNDQSDRDESDKDMNMSKYDDESTYPSLR